MPFEPLRFVHVADLMLDCALEQTGPLPDNIRQIAEEASFHAWESILKLCRDEHVDCLLLVGNSFREAEKSLRARVALESGFRRLEEVGIRVFVMPGSADPPEAWQSMPELPDNVTVFYGQSDDAVAVLRDGKVIAAVSAGGTRMPFARALGNETAPQETRRKPFLIRLLNLDRDVSHRRKSSDILTAANNADAAAASPQTQVLLELSNTDLDYLALGGGDVREANRFQNAIAHNPGRVQGLRPAETGPHGCTLVDVDADGTVDSRFVPVAPVRRESYCIEVEPEMQRHQLVAALRDATADLRIESAERLVLIQWTIRGSGPLFDDLNRSEMQREVMAEIRSGEWGHHHPAVHHSVDCYRHPPGESTADPLSAEFDQLLEEHGPRSRAGLEDALLRSDGGHSERTARMQNVIAHLNPDSVRDRARHLGLNWLSGGAETPLD